MDENTRLLLAARDGDRQAMRRFAAENYSEVRRLCTRLTDQASSEDLAQESYLRMLRALPRFRGDASARTWVMSITYRVCMDELRTRTRQRRRAMVMMRSEHGVAPDPAVTVATRDLIDGLHPDRRAALVLTQLWRYSYHEAAAICGCPPGTIRSRVARARGDLCRELGAA